jgi:hypothetical protein
VGDHLPDGLVIPRGESFEIESDWAKGGSLASERAGGEWLGGNSEAGNDSSGSEMDARIAQNRETGLAENVHFHQTKSFHGMHIEMSSGIARVAGEYRGEVEDRRAREDDPAWMHFGMAGKTVESSC